MILKHKITPSVVVETFGHLTKLTNQSKFKKVPKNVKSTNKTLGTSVLNSLMSPSSLIILSMWYEFTSVHVVRYQITSGCAMSTYIYI